MQVEDSHHQGAALAPVVPAPQSTAEGRVTPPKLAPWPLRHRP